MHRANCYFGSGSPRHTRASLSPYIVYTIANHPLFSDISPPLQLFLPLFALPQLSSLPFHSVFQNKNRNSMRYSSSLYNAFMKLCMFLHTSKYVPYTKFLSPDIFKYSLWLITHLYARRRPWWQANLATLLCMTCKQTIIAYSKATSRLLQYNHHHFEWYSCKVVNYLLLSLTKTRTWELLIIKTLKFLECTLWYKISSSAPCTRNMIW